MSKSVAVIFIFESLGSINMFDKIGSVVFFSIIPLGCPNAFKKTSLLIENYILYFKEIFSLFLLHFVLSHYLF